MTGVKFRPGSLSIPSERVASDHVWRFGTLDCVSDNLACFNDGFGDSGSFLDIGGHRFYVAKPFPEEVTDILNPLSDGGLSCGESCDFGAMVEVRVNSIKLPLFYQNLPYHTTFRSGNTNLPLFYQVFANRVNRLD
jgi:hypothetical protein